MGMAWVILAGVAALAMPPVAQAFFLPPSSRLSHQPTLGSIRRQTFLAEPTTGRAAHPSQSIPCPAAGAVASDGAASERRRSRVARMSAGEGGDAGDSLPSQEEGSATPARTPAEPVGAAGAVEDDLLMEIVGQDYGMMALLRNDKFKGLIVLLRNIPPNEWVTEVAKAYPDDDEVKGMMAQVGKLMRMIDYYQAKNLKKP